MQRMLTRRRLYAVLRSPLPGAGRRPHRAESFAGSSFAWTLPFLFCLVAACTVTPKQPVASVTLPETWSERPETATNAQPVELARWWNTFQDSALQALIERGIGQNRDIREATARVREARAARLVNLAPRWPRLGSSTSYTRSLSSRTTTSLSSNFLDDESTRTDNSESPVGTSLGFGQERNFYQMGLDASWEIDLFGRLHWAERALGADISAAEEDRRAVLVALLAEIARTYIELRGAQQRLRIAQRHIQAQQDSVEVTQARYQAGLTSALDAAEAGALLANIRAQIPPLQTTVKQTLHRLSVLVGQPPAAFTPALSQDQPIPRADLASDIGLPSELLRRRPDIRRAERELEAATARVGVATTDLFPRLTLTGRLGTQGLDVTDLAKGAGLSWATGPALSWPVFDAGRIRAAIKVQDARQAQALARYEQVILTGLEEVENALVAYSQEQARQQWLTAAITAHTDAVEIATERYLSGLENYLSVALARRALHTAQDAFAQSQTALAAHVIALYTALGGGWDTTWPPG